MSQALYRKYRPQGWAEVVGQEHVLQTLKNAIAADRIGHAYLFAGPRGTGKTTLARLLAKAVNCLNPDPAQRPDNACEHCKAVAENRFMDLIEIDAASNTGVDDIRDLREKINFSPSQGKFKIYIIDEVHMLSTAAFNALLKTLEEPPPHAIFVLATTEIHKIPATVLSRCQRHEFRRVPVDEIVSQLKYIVNAENLQADDDALILIARQAAGGMRDAISLLDQLSSIGSKITLGIAQTVLGTATSQSVLKIVASVRDREPALGLEEIHRALDAGADSRSLARQIVDYLRGLMLIQMGNADQVEATADIRKQMQAHANGFSTGDVLRMTKAFNSAATDLRGGWQPSLNLELALAEVMETPQIVTTLPQAVEAPRVKASAESQPQKTVSAPMVKQEAGISSNDVLAVWKQIAQSLSKSQANLAALLNSVRMVDVQGDIVVLGFASNVLVEKMDKPEHIQILQKALADALGAQFKISCTVTNAKGKLPSHVAQDGMVAAAVNHGGEIVDM